MATWVHSQKFLAYHGSRFQDASTILQNEEGQWLGILPAAVDPSEASRVVNHPGLSYGGLLHTGKLHGQAMIDALTALCSHYHSAGYQTLRYKAIPSFYHQSPSQDDLYALFRLNAKRYRVDLASIIDLEHRPKPNQKQKWELQQASKNGVTACEESNAAALWVVLEDNLKRKHGAKPVHSLEEIVWLKERFPNEIRFISAYHQNQLIAGFVLFITKMTAHLQYSASSETGYELYALHPVVDYCLQLSQSLGCRYFDFGISNEQEGRYLNEGLHRFKAKFGSGGAIHEFYDLALGPSE
ncbi:MAG: GNAT family N-acetyltransferase [Vampirovibrionales bacterium]|nr:GNAT family N-acetyltransferase [Vampirovibrionales bacterium]